MAMRFLVCTALAAGLLLLSAGHASAQTPSEADRKKAAALYAEGQNHYDLARFDQAITAWAAAYELSREPVLLYNIAQAHRLKGDCKQALAVYRSYLRVSPTASNRTQTEDHIAAMEKCIATGTAPPRGAGEPGKPAPKPATTPPPKPVATTPAPPKPVATTPPPKPATTPPPKPVATTPPKPVATTPPKPVATTPAPPKPVATTPPKPAPQKPVATAPGPKAPSPGQAAAGSAGAGDGSSAIIGGSGDRGSTDTPRPWYNEPRRLTAIGVTTGGAILVGVGLAYAAKSSSINDDLTARFENGGTWDAEARSLESDAQSAQTISIVGLSVGTAAVVTGGLLWFYWPPKKRGPSLDVNVGSNHAAASARWTF